MDPRTAGLLAGAIIAASMWFVLGRWPRQRHRSISMHVADRRATFLLFAVTSTAGSVLLFVFAAGWLAPMLQLHGSFMVLFTIALAGQLTAAWIPSTTGKLEHWHNVAAYTMASLLPFILGFLLFSPVVPVALKFFTLVAISWMVVMLFLLFLVPRIKRLYLPLQLIYIWLFYSVLIIAAFVV